MVPGSEVSSADPRDTRIQELEARLEESEETLGAIRRGDFDAVVVEGPNQERLVYTLENADRPYRVLIEQIQEGAFTLSAEGALLYCNPRVAAMLAHSPEGLIGQSLQAFVVVKERRTLLRLLREADACGSARGELCLQVSTGEHLPIHVSLSRLPRGDGAALLCGVLTDLTQQRQHLHELAEANTRLQTQSEERERIEEALRQSQKMEAIGQLTGGVAHDFNNLLTIIRSSVDFLRRPDLAEARRHRYMDAVSDTVDRAAKLTSQLLAFARRQTLTPEVFDVGEKLRGVAEMLDTVTGARVQVLTHLPIATCFIRADTSQFETALVNMAVNARDAMNGEGELILELRCSSTLPSIRGHAGSDKPFVAVSVKDTGIGIAPDQLGRVFEPFYTTKEVGKGTGLGLSQVFGFAKQSGGDVEVVSTVGLGATFTLYLPQVDVVLVERPTVTEPLRSPLGAGQCVLVVEDNIEVGRFCTQILEDLGYVTVWATNAEEALERLGAHGAGFDAVFSDVVMPGMGGLELARRLRVRLPWLPVVLASGYSHILAREDDHGFEVLHKPYSAEQVGRILSRVIGRPLATSEPQMSAAGALREPLAAIVDGDRLAALERYGVLDTSPQASFDEIVMLARTLCAAPTALISFVAEERQWFKARSGFGPTQTSLSHSVCIHALQEPGPLVIPDLRADTRTNENPLVTGNAALRFYAGAPLRTLDGHTLGTLCILDTISRPQGLSSEQTQGLQALAALVMAQLELQRELRASRLGTTAPSSD